MNLVDIGEKVQLEKGQAAGLWRKLKGKVAIVVGHDDTMRECTYYVLDWLDDDLNEEFNEMQSDVFEKVTT